jgi:probable F420-dependent oxidoreductase
VTVSICAYNLPAMELLRLAVAADEFGFDALWLGEHILLPVGYGSEHPTHDATDQHAAITGPIISLDTHLLDPWVALGAIAGATTRLRLATGIYLLSLRHPLLTARTACTLQQMSGGRLVLGVGSGWLSEEFGALGVPFDERRQRFDECIEVVRRAWRGGPFAHDGSAFHFAPVQITAQPTVVPLVLGGNSGPALRRAVTVGDGWFSSGTPTFAAALGLRDRLRALRAETDRAGEFRCYFRVERPDRALIERYRAEGIDDVVIWADRVWPSGPLAQQRAALERTADALGLTAIR